MEKILGLDLGTNSIGWAIRDTNEAENQIIDKGVLVFDKGVGQDSNGHEQPKVKARTDARGRRRNYQAEKYRKWELLECLITNQMCPLTIEELNKWRHYKKGTGRVYPTSKEFHQWLRFDFNGDGKPDFVQFGFSKHENCYLFRWLSVSEKEEHKKIFKENPQLLGRVFYQLVQRRGFNTGDGNEGETKLIEEGRKNQETKEIEVVGIKVIDKLIKEKYKSLGAALYWGQKNNELETTNNNRIRNRFTYRNYFENEVDLIFENLGLDKHSDFFKTIKKCIVWQRPLRSQKGLVGYCTLEAPMKSNTGIYYKPGKKRIPLSHPLYEEYRTWCFINNLKIEVPEGTSKLKFLNEVIYPMFNRSSDFYFSDKKNAEGKIISKGLKTKIEEAGGKVLSLYDKDLDEEDEGTRYNANLFQNKLEKLFGENWKEILKWDETLHSYGESKEKSRDYLRAEDIWHLFYDAFETKKQKDDVAEKLFSIFKKHFPDKEFEKKDFEKSPLGGKGYASLSASAIRKILPYLKQGMIYSQAVFIANLDKVFGEKLSAQEIDNISKDFNNILLKHKSDKEIYGIVNDLISDRLYHQERIAMGENHTLDNYDNTDIENKIKTSFKKKIWNRKTDEQKKEFKEDVALLYLSFLKQPMGIEKSKLFLKIYRLKDKLISLLIDKYKADPLRIKNYLWHPSEQEKYPPAFFKKDEKGEIIKDSSGNSILFLGDPNPISRGFKNPMAMKTLHILKKHLNYLLRVEKINTNTKVVVEIARELNDANKRKAIEKFQNTNRKKRGDYKKKIQECFEESGIKNRTITEFLLDRYQLWAEQTEKCMYCTNNIRCSDVLNGTAQIEHTIPAKLSNCDELFNLTIAHPECNAKKAKRIPFEWKDNYELIKNNVRFMYAKFKQHEENFENALERTKNAKDKTSKDAAIQKRHFEKMHMDYWRKKYDAFVIEEVTNQFRRQQLTDTQIITKYALPYLKTVFNRVDVQKGSTTAKFRKIFQINPEVGPKDRSEHTHHYEDAAILTLIPPASIRDNIMKDYNEAVDNNTLNNYLHPKPRHWENFHQSHITSIKEEIIINHISENRTLKQSFKYKRKKGEFVKDKNGNKIWQRGTTTRGKLHDESIFGMVKMPVSEFDEKDKKYRLKITDGKITFNKNEKRNDDLFIVKKIKLTDIKSLDDFEKIVIDPNLGYYLKNEIKIRIEKKNKKFEEVILEPFYAFGKAKDKNGNPLQPIRHLRCKIKTGANSYVQFPAEIKTVESAFESKRLHKRQTYANNAELPVCGIYEWEEKGIIEREIEPVSILNMSKSYHFEKNPNYIEENKFIFKGSGKNRREIIKNLSIVLYKKQHVIFYKNSIDELKELYKENKKDFTKRIYKVLKFEDGKIFFDYHLTSLSDTDIMKEMEKQTLPKKGASKVNYKNPPLRLRLSQGALNMAIEGKHFKMEIDGTIEWSNTV